MAALSLLGVERLDALAARATLSSVLKNRDDLTWCSAGVRHGWSAVPDAGAVPAVPAVLVEAAAFATGLATALRRPGVPVSPDRVGSFAAALRLAPPASRSPLYWSAPDSCGEQNAPPPVGAEPRTRPARSEGRPVDGSADGGAASGSTPDSSDGPEAQVPLAVSGAERLQESSFADLSADEVAEVRRLVRRIVPQRTAWRACPRRRCSRRSCARTTRSRRLRPP